VPVFVGDAATQGLAHGGRVPHDTDAP
jgi:hypothetical protein